MEKIDALQAELMATRVMISALAIAAPNQEQVRDLFDAGVNKLMPDFLPTNVNQQFLDHLQSNLDRLRALVS